MKNSILFILSAVLLSSCASTPKAPRALVKVELERLCVEGGNGACAALGHPVGEGTPQYAILQGPSSNHQARFVVQTPKNKELFYFVNPIQKSKTTSTSEPMQVIPIRKMAGATQWSLDHLEVFDLQQGTPYQLIIFDSQGRLEDAREFTAPDLNKKSPKIALASCMDDGLEKEQNEMWPLVAQAKPDLIFLIGDNVYADRNLDHTGALQPEDFWKRYAATRKSLKIFYQWHLTPILAVWDDHDYGKNDGDRTFPHKNLAKEVFNTFFPQEKSAPQFDRGPGVSSWLEAYKIGFAFLDDRSFRSPNGLDSLDQTHFGADQEQWLKDKMATFKGPIVLISGDQFFGGYHSFESYQGSHPKRFESHLKELKAYKYPIAFFSGDRHLAEIIEIPKTELGYKTYELTSSGIHAKVFADAFQRNPSPKKIAGIAGQYNFMTIDFSKSKPHALEMNVKSIGPQNKIHFSKKLKVQK